jgi:hypothetical protein
MIATEFIWDSQRVLLHFFQSLFRSSSFEELTISSSAMEAVVLSDQNKTPLIIEVNDFLFLSLCFHGFLILFSSFLCRF